MLSYLRTEHRASPIESRVEWHAGSFSCPLLFQWPQ